MNEQQFLERAHANPHDDSPEFLDALAGQPQRHALLQHLKSLDADIRRGLESVTPPEHLQQTLLAIPAASQPDAANASFWRRSFQYAATVLLAIGVTALVFQTNASPMEEMVFSHIYSEMYFFEDDSPMTLDEVNTIMNDLVGTDFASSNDMESLEINHTQDCWVDFSNGIRGVHLVMKGNVGTVTVMVIPNTPLDDAMTISDDRFEGMISPTPGGNLVVVGEKQEDIQQYSTLMAANINW